MKLRLIVAAAVLATATGPLEAKPADAKPPLSATSPVVVHETGHPHIRSAGRKDCPLGKVYSSYQRRCVWWLPIRS